MSRDLISILKQGASAMSGNRSLLILICGVAIVNVDLTLGAILDSPVCVTGQLLAHVPLGPHTASDDT